MCANVSGSPTVSIIHLSQCGGGSFFSLIALEGYYEITVPLNMHAVSVKLDLRRPQRL